MTYCNIYEYCKAVLGYSTFQCGLVNHSTVNFMHSITISFSMYYTVWEIIKAYVLLKLNILNDFLCPSIRLSRDFVDGVLINCALIYFFHK